MNKKIYSMLLVALLAAPFAEAQKKVKSKTKTVSPPAQKIVETPIAPEPLNKTVEDLAQTIKAADLSGYLHVLASDEYEGRETGQKGQKMAAEYISKFFKENGLAGPVLTNEASPYYQSFNLERSTWKMAELKIGSTNYTFMHDFYLLGSEPAETSQTLDLVFAGYGIETPKHSEYKNLDVKGKTVVILAGEPMDAKGNYLVSGTKTESPWGADYRTKTRLAAQKGAKNVIIIADGSDQEFRKQIDYYKHWIDAPTLSFPDKTKKTPTIFVSRTVGAALLGTSAKKLDAFEKQVSQAGKPVASKFKPAKNAELKAEKEKSVLTTENVLGFIEGTDKKDEVLVITAHYDHIGMDPTKSGDQIFNGADDDGSGTSAVLELAQAFAEAKKAGVGPRRSILFMAVTGEEKGLLGSEYYTNNPVFPLKNTVANLNIDMIGRLDKAHKDDKNYIYVIGSDKLSSELHQINEDENAQRTKLKLDYTYNDENDPNRFYYRSDHYNFAKNNVPVIFYFNGVHEDYHKETDEVEKILFDKMENITRLVFYTAWELANRDERIKVDSNKK